MYPRFQWLLTVQQHGLEGPSSLSPYLHFQLSLVQPPKPLPVHHPLYLLKHVTHVWTFMPWRVLFPLHGVSQPWQTLPLILQHSSMFSPLFFTIAGSPQLDVMAPYTEPSVLFSTFITAPFTLYGDCLYVFPSVHSFYVLLCDDQSGVAMRWDRDRLRKTMSAILTRLRNGRHCTPHRVTGKGPGLGQEAEDRSRGKSRSASSLGFLQER